MINLFLKLFQDIIFNEKILFGYQIQCIYLRSLSLSRLELDFPPPSSPFTSSYRCQTDQHVEPSEWERFQKGGKIVKLALVSMYRFFTLLLCNYHHVLHELRAVRVCVRKCMHFIRRLVWGFVFSWLRNLPVNLLDVFC